MASMVLSDGDRYVGLVQLLALAAACIAIVGIARRLGLSRAAALFGALAFATFTVVALQTPTALTDLVVASLLIVCAYFALGSSRAELGLCATALALGIGTKGTAVFALPVLAAFALASQPRSRWWSLAGAGAAGVAAGSFWFVINLVETGDPRGGFTLPGIEPVFERIRLSFVDLFELSDAEATGWLASPLWGLGAVAVGSAVGAALAVRGRRRAGGVALIVGVLAFFAAPLIVTWAQVADRVLAHARSALGLGSGPTSRLPQGFIESPMHSSYGLSFVVLLVGAGALVVERRAAAASTGGGARRARRRSDLGAADRAYARLRPAAHALRGLLRRPGRDGVRNFASRAAVGMDIGVADGGDARVLGRVLRPPPRGSRVLLGESNSRQDGTLVRPGGEWQRRPRRVPLSRGPDSSSGDDRARRRTPTPTSTLPGTPSYDARFCSSPPAGRCPRMPSGSWSARRGRRTRVASRRAGGGSSSRPRAAGGSSAVPEAAARQARLRPTERVPTRPAAPKTMSAGTTGIANSMIV